MNKLNIYRIRIVMTGRGGVEAAFVQNICGGDSDEVRGEIEKFCMEMEEKYCCSVRCESVELIQEVKTDD